MIILSDSNNNVVDSFVDGTKVTNLAGVNAELFIDPTTNALSYKYVAII